MPEIIASANIQGVYHVRLGVYEDERGRFLETFRKSWFPQRNWGNVQVNRSESRAGVLRGLHYHFRQVDYWHVLRGSLRAGLVDVRPDSPTFKHTEIVPMSGAVGEGLFIPCGVAHGFVALTDVLMTYVVDNYYDPGDEHGIAWNDPDLALEWGVVQPVLSGRDRQNPRLAAVPVDSLPKIIGQDLQD
jgi:dTDP-4-dehydrorhamnose 3,5-epimerase